MLTVNPAGRGFVTVDLQNDAGDPLGHAEMPPFQDPPRVATLRGRTFYLLGRDEARDRLVYVQTVPYRFGAVTDTSGLLAGGVT